MLHDLHGDANGSGFGLPDDVDAEMDSAFLYGQPVDQLSDEEIDALWVADQERREREAGTTPARGSLTRLVFTAFTDDMLIRAIDLLDRNAVANITDLHRSRLLDAATAEVLHRLKQRPVNAPR
jgi:hypothetical protein